jgi:general secretion pathway protein J
MTGSRRQRGADRTPIEQPDAGLTLVEMIVALALGALVVAFLAQGTGLLRAFTHVADTVAAQDEVLAVRDHLRRTLASTMTGGSGTQRTVLAGIGDTVVFTVPGDRLLETGGPVRITLAAVVEGHRLSLAETRAPVEGDEGRTRTRRLVEGAAAVSFSFFGALSGDAAPTWSPEWTDPGSSPQLVRIDVRFPPGDKRRWPPFVVFLPSGGAPATAAGSDTGAGSQSGAQATARNGSP